MTDSNRLESFAEFVRDVEPHLRRAFAGTFGPNLGHDAVADALAYAWEHWERIREMENPAGYLYRMAMRDAPRLGRRPLSSPVRPRSRCRGWSRG